MTKTTREGGFSKILSTLFCCCFAFLLQAQLTVTLTPQNPTCGSVPNGAISSSVSGGSGPFSYLWSNGAITPDLTNILEGTYSLTVSNASGSTGTASVTLVAPPTIGVNISSDCNAPLSATANVTGGTAPFMYMWSNGSNVPTINNLSPGEYCVTIMDANTCATFTCSDIGLPPNVTVTTTDAGCVGGTGSATANPSGGNAPYSYLWNTGATTPTISGLVAGTYTVTVTGSNGCSTVSSGVVGSSGSSFSVWLNATPPSCNANTGSITAMANGGVFPYAYLWNTGATSQTITNLGAGVYTVTVTDATGCTSQKTATLASNSTVGAWVMSTPTTCPNSNDGTASVSGMGGLQPYSYLWNTGQTGNLITGLSAGTYTVTVTDATGCTGSGSTVVSAANPFSVNVVGNDATGCGSTDGMAIATLNGGNAPFTYQWSNGANGSSITNVGEGTYVVTVTDNNGCQVVGSVFIDAPDSFMVQLQSTGAACGTNGSITAFPFGGTAPYTYQWSNGANTQVISNLVAGAYSVTVSDATGCTGTATTTISGAPVLTIDAIITNVLCYTDATGSIDASGWGGTPPYTYLWNTGQTTGIINNLIAGTYMVTVTDAAGCTETATLTVSEPMPIMIDVSTVDAGCSNASTGSVTATVSAGTPPYSYNWSNGGNTTTITNLTAGSYFLTVTDANFCTAVALANVTGSPGINVTVSKTNIDCFGGNTGSATAMVAGGTAPFLYQWSNGGNTPTINNLTVGTYMVTVTDAAGCTAVASVNIAQPPAINLAISSTPAVCTGNTNGMATVTATGGTPGYTYLWNTGAVTPTINNLAPGTYTVTVTDANGCPQTASTTIIESADYTIDVATQDAICFGESTGSVLVSGWGGTPPYTYIWNTGSTNPQLMNLAAGIYTVTVTDAAGCVIAENVTINEPPLLTATATGIDPVCNGNTGTATAIGAGGIPPYTYQWDNFQTTPTISNLAAGTYAVTVFDANFCSATASVTINPGANILAMVSTTNVSCFGLNDGTATATGMNGTAPYSYAWSNGGNTQTIANLTTGIYTVTATDVNGCSATASGTVTQPSQITVNVSDTDIACFGETTGTATANASGGNPAYSYAWSNGTSGQSISNLAAGTYTVTVTDQNGCTATGSTTISQQAEIILSTSTSPAACSSNTGSATVSVSGGNTPYTFAWSNGGNVATISNLAAGNYTVTVTDANGCSQTTSATVSGSAVLSVSIGATDVSCFGANDGSATANGSGGTPNYTYAWSNGATTQTINNLTAGSYSLTLTDAVGCTAVATTTIAQPSSIQLTVSSTNVTCSGGTNGTASSTAAGGNGGFSFAWNNGANTANLSNLTAGTYTVTVTDQNGCTAMGSTTVSQPNPIVISLNVNDPGCVGNDGSITANPTGGTPAYAYVWSTGATTPSISNLTAGNYTVTVTDQNNCTATASTNLVAPSNVTVNITTQNTCAGTNNGSATANPSGGATPYVFVWSNGENTMAINGLGVGTYNVTITDANGCTATASAAVNAANNPACIAVVTNAISTTGGNDGAVTVNLNNANPTDTYLWNTGGTTQTISNLSAATYSVTVTGANGCTSTCQVVLPNPSPCDNVTDAGEICCDQTLCGPGGDPAPLTETMPAVGGSGPIEYLWMFSTVPGPFDPNTWTIIPGATGASYDPGPIYETTFFVRCVRRQPCVNYLETNIITIVVDNVAFAEINGPDFVCVNEANTYTATFSGGNATYQWSFPNATPSTANTISVTDVVWNVTGFNDVTLTVTEDGCVSTAILTIFVSNSGILCSSPLEIVVTPQNQNLVAVEWEMEMPGNVEYDYTIERSPDGLEFFALGAMNETHYSNGSFQFMDEQPKRGRSFYRVKLSDDSGDFKYSNTEEISLRADLGLAFLYPNPADDFLYIELVENLGAEEITVELISPNGMVLETLMVDQEAVRTPLDLSAYPQGVYYLVLNFNGNRQEAMRVVRL